MKKKFAVVEARLNPFREQTQTEIEVVSKEEFDLNKKLIKKILFESDNEQECRNARWEFEYGETYESFPITVKDLISYLQTLPENAKLCTNNSRSWKRWDIYNKVRTLEDIKKYIQVLDRAEIGGEVIEGTFVSIYDSKHVDY